MLIARVRGVVGPLSSKSNVGYVSKTLRGVLYAFFQNSIYTYIYMYIYIYIVIQRILIIMMMT